MTEQTIKKEYSRFSGMHRFEHIILIVTFTGLGLTGIPQRYAGAAWARTMIDVMGGIESVRIIHRVMATLMIAESIYHAGVLGFKLFVLGHRSSMMFGLRDVKDMRDFVLFNLGLRKEHPKMPKYNFGEKMEYLALIWGTLVMVATGFIMWNPIAFANLLPGDWIPAARAAHSGEALLAVLSILIWHMYNVHFKHFNKAMFTGKLTYEQMLEEHGEELERIERGEKEFEYPPEVIAKRKRQFWPVAVVVGLIGLGVLIWAVTFEDSAITTVPRQNVVVYAPKVTPDNADPQLGAELWSTVRCASCHGDDAMGTTVAPQVKGTELTFDQFHLRIREGGEQMPAFSAGEIPDGYLLHLWAWLTENAAP